MRTESGLSALRQDILSENTECISAGRGDLIFNGNLRINGIFSGKVNVSGFLTLGPKARMTGEVTAQDLSVEGHLVGTVKVLNRVCFHSGSFFSGSITASEAEISKTCTISGQSYFNRIVEKEAVPNNMNTGFHVGDSTISDNMIFPSFHF